MFEFEFEFEMAERERTAWWGGWFGGGDAVSAGRKMGLGGVVAGYRLRLWGFGW